MTNKEAIHKLIGYRRFIEKMAMTIPGFIFDAEPFDLAISALEKQSRIITVTDAECGLLASISDKDIIEENGVHVIISEEKQETAKIVIRKSKGGVTLWHECSKCGEPVDAKDMFCSGCGRKLIPLSEPYTEEDNEG